MTLVSRARTWFRNFRGAPEPRDTWARDARRHNAADARASALLFRMLSPVQRADFQAYGYFAAKVAGLGTFWILPSTFFNVLHAETGRCYCAVSRAELPLADLMLAQKLWLENDPQSFLAVANRRMELIPEMVPESLRPRRVLETRGAWQIRSARCSDISVIPYESRLP